MLDPVCDETIAEGGPEDLLDTKGHEIMAYVRLPVTYHADPHVTAPG